MGDATSTATPTSMILHVHDAWVDMQAKHIHIHKIKTNETFFKNLNVATQIVLYDVSKFGPQP